MKMDHIEAAVLSPREKLHIRARELATIAGRLSGEILQFDYEQAKRDVTGEVDRDRQNAFLYTNRKPVAWVRGPAMHLPIQTLNKK